MTDSNENRKNLFNKKITEGDPDSIRKFASVCTELEDDVCKDMDEKVCSIIEGVYEKITATFDLAYLKKLDCRFVGLEQAQVVFNNDYIKEISVSTKLMDEEEGLVLYPVVLKLIDGSTIKVMIVREAEEDSDEADGKGEDE